MKPKILTAAQIDMLAQRLSETPLEPNASAKKAGDNLARLLVARTGQERAALAFASILSAATFERAEARLTLVLDYGTTEPAVEPQPQSGLSTHQTSAACQMAPPKPPSG